MQKFIQFNANINHISKLFKRIFTFDIVKNIPFLSIGKIVKNFRLSSFNGLAMPTKEIHNSLFQIYHKFLTLAFRFKFL